ncbi:type I-Fv CRISPR-associated protein Cas5fv [Methylomonas sp. SURF-1]|uniref:Type I-Fv CRISPR-associated protein Cas5fv n=1 Tax=Methylomonas aurea TaxID=2952224 RepID=A0ABT1UFS4_9GAMM|nr:type I-Fv CRISPR-associated protein Cas5fv [Methylomonas sp. SURF-1]MCQ8181078.1 type I-Fv CRISPR-associated protein Cas5fv [Methylomonas sp. SURF-1]
MRITIKYEASWRNSFLDGSNNEPIPKSGRNFIATIKTLKDNPKNFIKREITIDTVMGILNRLIGDQRKLYQARQSKNYFFDNLEQFITFEDQQDDLKPINNEVVYLRNVGKSDDPTSFVGAIKVNDPVFISEYSSELWGILNLNFYELCKFICAEDYKVESKQRFDPFIISDLFKELNTLKSVEVNEDIEKALLILSEHFSGVEYRKANDKVKPGEIYCGALYLQIKRLSNISDISKHLTKSGAISGISKRIFTAKDFMGQYSTGGKKTSWGNPYLLAEKRKGEGDVVSSLAKANGTLDINLDIPEAKAQQLKEMIEAAGVSSFYLGKKGLAYVDVIR